jgi:hypothetical protein
MVIYATLVYGPVAGFLVELFRTKIRYTSFGPIDVRDVRRLRDNLAIPIPLQIGVSSIEKCRVPFAGIEAFDRHGADLQVHIVPSLGHLLDLET